MRICFLTQQYGNYKSGVGMYSTNLINSLADLNYDITVICPKDTEREFTSNKIKLIEIEVKAWDPSHGHWFTLSWQFSKKLKKLLKNYKFDIVHFTDARESLFYQERILAIGTMHDYYFMDADFNPIIFKRSYKDWVLRFFYYTFVKYFEKKAIQKLCLIISNSKFVKQKLINKYNVDELKIKTIYYGITKQNKIIIGQRDENQILFAGGNFQRKGFDILLQALNLLVNKNQKLKLIVAGKSKLEKYYLRLAKNMNLSNNILFIGHQLNKDVINSMAKSSIFVMPSLIEGFGIVFLEAMSVGTPVIGGKVGGTPELIKDGENGFLIDSGDYISLAKKINLLLTNKEIRNKFIYNGYKTCDFFSLSRMVKNHVEIYNQIAPTKI